MPIINYSYCPAFWKIIPASFIFPFCTWTMYGQATTNDHGLTVMGIFYLTIQETTLLYYLMCIFSALLSVLFIISYPIIWSQRDKPLVLSDDHLLIPKSGFRKQKIIPYKSVTKVHLSNARNVASLDVEWEQNRVQINPKFFKSKKIFEDFNNKFCERVRLAAGPSLAKKPLS